MAKDTQNNRKNQLIVKLGKIRKASWFPHEIKPTSPEWENSEIAFLSKPNILDYRNLY